jgi:hypothetical protein
LWYIYAHVLICFLVYVRYAQFARRKQMVIECKFKAIPARLGRSCVCLF